VNLRSQRFNQHMTAGSLLVEVGTSGNTLQEALAGARLFARAAGQEYLSRPALSQQADPAVPVRHTR
jgi:stage II sporulation protein P